MIPSPSDANPKNNTKIIYFIFDKYDLSFTRSMAHQAALTERVQKLKKLTRHR